MARGALMRLPAARFQRIASYDGRGMLPGTDVACLATAPYRVLIREWLIKLL